MSHLIWRNTVLAFLGLLLSVYPHADCGEEQTAILALGANENGDQSGLADLLAKIEKSRPKDVGKMNDGAIVRIVVPAHLARDSNLLLLSGLSQLRELTLRFVSAEIALSSNGVSALRQIRNLECIKIECGGQLPAGVLQGICQIPSLRELTLGRATPVADEYACLTNATNLIELSILDAPRFGDKDLETLIRLPFLRKITLVNTAVSVNWPNIISSMPSLREMTVQQSEISLTWRRIW